MFEKRFDVRSFLPPVDIGDSPTTLLIQEYIGNLCNALASVVKDGAAKAPDICSECVRLQTRTMSTISRK